MKINKKYIFIIPLTPDNLTTTVRKQLWLLCQKALIVQSYTNWSALVIGSTKITIEEDCRFVQIRSEGTKEEKLQIATDYIINNRIQGDYIIRLDDDDIISPTILEKVSKLDFDLYVDKTQWFWHYESGMVSNRVWHWFPNTCIHKREHALTAWGDYAKGKFKKYKEQALLIENDHSKLHPYYRGKKVLLADKNHPIYLRTITSTSITAQNALNHESYLKRFGLWRNNNLNDFQFLNHYNRQNFNAAPHYTFKEVVLQKYYNLRSKLAYLKQ